MFPDLTSRSAHLYDRACEVMAGGNTRATVFSTPYQLYAATASGYRIIDVDGVERIDFQNNYTVLIHGHAHPAIVETVNEQLRHGTCYGLATEAEVRLAELLCSRVPSFEHIRFVNSGTEAVMAAIKAARAYTSRPKIAKIEGAYNGAYDFVDVSIRRKPIDWQKLTHNVAMPESSGTPECVLSNVVIIPFNDPITAEKVLEQHKDELAAIIVDPMPPRVGLIPATSEFLSMLHDFTRRNDSLLIFDEVISFRLGYGGAQTNIGIDPDLTAIGKFVGGGLPFGAVAGKKEVMAVFDLRGGNPSIWHGGTFNANPITMAAGLTTMEMLTPGEFEHLATLGTQARDQIMGAFKAADVAGQVTGLGSLFRIHCTSRPFLTYRDFYPTESERNQIEWLIRYALNHGFLLTAIGMGAISTVMDERVIDRLAETVFEGLQTMKKQGIANP